MFLATSIYSGALHISPMRLFDNEADAWRHARTLADKPRVYELFSDKEPRLCKDPRAKK